jgi:hypothetical protein|tara:strand:+ start:93 stop:317 length:225 start_codon:yes stop_codon:yes gene_type:complete
MTTLTNQKSTIALEDIKDMIYNKSMYPQPKELLQEIHTRGVIYSILCSLNREKTLKPTFDNVAIALKTHKKRQS